MTTEDDFQSQLDAHPDDHQTRMVFADWLEEHDDPRAEGYRAIGRIRLKLFPSSQVRHFTVFADTNLRTDSVSVPRDWFDLVKGGSCHFTDGTPANERSLWVDFTTRRELEDAVARAFSKLPAARRTEILSTGDVT